jgi:two-component system phosphate regulon response regulator OmpR
MLVSTEQPHILVVDDDPRLRDLLRRYLADHGCRVACAADAQEARQNLANVAFDLIVLDVMMPGEDGLQFTAWLRRTSKVPILLLTAMDEPEHRIAGLDLGADDYLGKPFEPRELVARIRTILRRAPPPPAEPERTEVKFGNFRFDLKRGELSDAGGPVRLTPAESGLLDALARNPGTAMSREELSRGEDADQPAGDDGEPGALRAVDVTVTRLRRKIEADPKFPRYLQTVRGKGYVLRLD